MFWKRNGKQAEDYDRTGKIPVIRASICTGEKVAGFKEAKTGRFEDLMVIQTFLKRYGVKKEEIKKEW